MRRPAWLVWTILSTALCILAAGESVAADREGKFLALHGIEDVDDPPSGWVLETLDHSVGSGARIAIRGGYLAESASVPFRGNILYYQGFADSLLNHGPLFSVLSAAGYRVIAFDYPGQGGSSGSMNQTRVEEIPDLGDRAWDRFMRREQGRTRKVVLAWSTGGLAAYLAAARKRVDAVILVAPGIHVRALVGRFGQVTLGTLTSRPPGPGDPHVDPIRPGSPLLVPRFAADILVSSIRSHRVRIDPSIPGLAILTGTRDRYVKAEPSGKTLRANAPHFDIVSFPGSLHEVDNEVDEIRQPMFEAVLGFLTGLR